MDNKDRIRYTVADYKGNPVSIPASMVEEFLEEQERLKANPPKETDMPKMSLEEMLEMEARMLAEFD